MVHQVDVAAAEVAGPMGTARRLVPVLKALADENQLAILLALLDGDRSVTELTSVLGLSQTLVSHHLKTLRETELVTMAAQGRSNIYSVCCEALAEPVRLLATMGAGGFAGSSTGG